MGRGEASMFKETVHFCSLWPWRFFKIKSSQCYSWLFQGYCLKKKMSKCTLNCGKLYMLLLSLNIYTDPDCLTIILNDLILWIQKSFNALCFKSRHPSAHSPLWIISVLVKNSLFSLIKAFFKSIDYSS